MDYYQILGVPSTATEEEILKAYRRKAMQLHPDRNPGKDTSAEFQALEQAYAVLGEKESRAHYDAFGAPAPAQESRAQKVENEGLKALVSLFDQVFNATQDVTTQDIIGTVRRSVTAQQQQIQQQRKKCLKDMRKITAAARRLTESEEVFCYYLRTKARALRRQHQHLRFCTEVLEFAYKYLETVSYNVNPPPITGGGL